MDMHWTRRAIMGAALSAITAPAVAGAQEKAPNSQDKPAAANTAASAAPAVKGKLTDESLGRLLKAMGVEAKATEQRYDFAFKSTIEDAEWDFSMSAVLSQDGTSIWIMAWLDELPKSAADVPRTALLRLLSDNDKLGKGKFFAYIAANRRFVLQRVIPNENITTVAFRAALDDLGQSVVSTHSHWYTPNWASSTSEDPSNAPRSATQIKGSAPQTGAPPNTARPAGQTQATTEQSQQVAKPVQSATNDTKFTPSTKK